MNLLDLIFPGDIYCIACGRPLSVQVPGGVSLCSRCIDEIEWSAGRCCKKCCKPLPDENPFDLCHECKRYGDHLFRRAYACAIYSGHASEIVRSMKYKSRSWYADSIAAIMAARYFALADSETGELPHYDYIMHIPMNAEKRAVRGYDQAALIAAGLAGRIHIPHLKNILLRTRKTETMSGLSREIRRQNLIGAFTVPYDKIDIINGMSILLVDDVYTTGSSADACVRALTDAGAKEVDLIVFATGADVRFREDRPAVVESPGRLRAKGPT